MNNMSSMNNPATKPSNRTFQIRKPTKTTAEQEKALRDQLHIEIENKTKACSNPTYECSIPRIDGFEYCIRHILQDPRSPYKQCAYTYAINGKRCLQAAPKHDGKKDLGLTNFCFEHSRLMQLTKTRNTIGKYKQVETNEALLADLAHHVNIDKLRSTNSKTFSDADEEIDVVSPHVEPFKDLDNLKKFGAKKKRILDYASDSSSEDDTPTLSNTWKGYDWDNSDNESVDSQNEDMLKHAGIYTTEEATMITKQKMSRLQGLYTEQISRLNHLLKEKRRKYLQTIRKERETLCSIHDQPKDSAQERRLYEKLKALNHYHKKHGIEGVLHKKFQEKRAKITEGVIHKGPTFVKCIYTEGGVKCGERTLPCCKYCRRHILEDKKQVLFRACGVEKSGIVCQEPVPNIFEDSTCVLHINLPKQMAYTQKKFESETEEEEEDVIKKDIKDDIMDTDDAHITKETIETFETIEMLPVDDIGNNVTIAHDQQFEVIESESKDDVIEEEVEESDVVFEISETLVTEE